MAVVRILVTGFEPFDGQSLNPSWEVARALHGLQLQGEQGAQVTAVQLPCVFATALPTLQQALAQHRPDIVLALGQAEGRCDFSVERVAINVQDARIPDNAGAQPIDVPVIAGGPAAYFSTLPIKSLVAGLKAAGYPASVSQTAGTFVCNQVFYALQHTLAGLGVHSGFMHLPLLPEQAAQWKGPTLPSWPAPFQIAGVTQALALLVAQRQQKRGDAAITGGTLN
ncbi:Pyrrolidone-carboxylate peptidase [Limnohabitans sp. 63ED37-2]|nr:Pyrrolidone-carboxylate peptidase [Limnohabitans sp. 63ED37-2]